MSLFESASLVATPNGTKASKLYAVKPTDGAGDLSVTRATTATRVNSAGLIESVASNVPRLDYTNSTCPSILVEPQRTNIVLNSETLATQSVTVTAQSYTLSFYGSGTVALSGTHTASVVGLGTTRKTYTFTPTAGTLTLTITGTCTKGQLEAGSYATSYIPTTSASVTRNADVISKTGISSLIGQTEGTLFIDVLPNNTLSVNVPIRLDDTTSSNRIQLEWSGATTANLLIASGGSWSVLATGLSVPQNIHSKIAIAYKINDFVLYVNGTQKVNDTSGTVPVGMSSIRFNESSSTVFSGYYKTAALWKTRLSNSELVTLTTI